VAVSVPDQPAFVTTSEREVWQRLRKQLGDDCVLLANYRLSEPNKDHEADLVALMPDSGIVVMEVKGSHVWVEQDGHWMIHRAGGAQPIHPIDQARDATYALRHYVEADPRWGSRSRIRWSHHIVLARTDLDSGFATPECPRWQVSGLGDLADLGQRVWDTTSLHRTDARPPTRDDVDLIREILIGRNLPARDVGALAEDRAELADRLTMEQADLLRVTRLLNRVEIRGGAGSGKTVLAIRQAADLASGRATGERQGSRSSATATGWPTTCAGSCWLARGASSRRSWAPSRTSPGSGGSRSPGRGTTPTSGRTHCRPGWPKARRAWASRNGSMR
jgi:hypothetical protein